MLWGRVGAGEVYRGLMLVWVPGSGCRCWGSGPGSLSRTCWHSSLVPCGPGIGWSVAVPARGFSPSKPLSNSF